MCCVRTSLISPAWRLYAMVWSVSLVGVCECNSSARQVTLDRNQCRKPFAAAPTLQSSARPSLPPTRPYPYPFIRKDARGTRRLHALPHCASLSFAAQASALMWPTPLHQHSVRAFERPPRPRSCRPSTVVASAIFLAVYSWHCSHCGMVPTVVSSSSSLTAPWPPVRDGLA